MPHAVFPRSDSGAALQVAIVDAAYFLTAFQADHETRGGTVSEWTFRTTIHHLAPRPPATTSTLVVVPAAVDLSPSCAACSGLAVARAPCLGGLAGRIHALRAHPHAAPVACLLSTPLTPAIDIRLHFGFLSGVPSARGSIWPRSGGTAGSQPESHASAKLS